MTIKYRVTTAHFDSELGKPPDPKDNATTLTVTLRLEFIATEVSSGKVKDLSGKEFRTRGWTDGEIRQYLKDFKASVEDYWNNKMFILFPDQKRPEQAMKTMDYHGFLSSTIKANKPPYLKCGLTIEYCDKNCHSKVYILNLVPGQGRFQGLAYHKRDDPDAVVLRLDNQSAKEHKTTIGNDDYWQVPAAHEVGHVLGLDHVNAKSPECRLDKNAEICYGGTPYERNDIMGMGRAVTGEHAKTWLKAIRLHTGHEKGWRASHLSPPLEELLRP